MSKFDDEQSEQTDEQHWYVSEAFDFYLEDLINDFYILAVEIKLSVERANTIGEWERFKRYSRHSDNKEERAFLGDDIFSRDKSLKKTDWR